MQKLPHIIIFNPDQWRGDTLGHVGTPGVVTPTLDRLVETEAVSFRNAFCQNPVCTPSRCSFMSGWYPHVHGHRTMRYMLQPHEPVLLRTLKENGYRVWWGGKNDLIAAQYGYDAYCDIHVQAKCTPERPIRPNLHTYHAWRGESDSDTFYAFYAGRIEKPKGFPPDEDFVYDDDWHWVFSAIDFIKNAPPDQPLCIYLPLRHPHPPYVVEDPWYSMIDRNQIAPPAPAPEDWHGKPSILKGLHERQRLSSWTQDRLIELRATYYGMCARTDYELGLLIEVLKETGLYDDTALFFFSDHGDFTGDYGLVEKTQNTFEDCLTRVPLIIKPPKDTPTVPGIRDALVELVDFPATVEALTDITPQHTHFGRSLLPLIAGETDTHRDAVFCEGGRRHGETHAMELESPQDEGWLYWPRMSLQRSEGPEHTKAVMCRTHDYKYVRRLYEEDELYDLHKDPHELHNRIDDPTLADVQSSFKERLLDFLLDTGDVVPHTPDQRD